ncbi:MAG: hypothetical protein COA79_22850 [Planctomycetota bacterium]|nr:MAG: hypothetical protein COA79_22850 [Planctomycetota bacterium]
MRPPKTYNKTLYQLRNSINQLANDFGQLPSDEALAIKNNICSSTIKKVMQQLVKEGLIFRKRGIGTFINNQNATNLKLDKPEKKIKTITKFITILFPDDVFNGKDFNISGIYQDIINGVSEVLSENKLQLAIKFIDQSENEHCLNNFTEQIKKNKMHGLIVIGSLKDEIQIKINKLNIPVVMLDHWAGENIDFDTFENDSLRDTIELICSLVSLGHKKIGFIDRIDSNKNPMRLEGYKLALKSSKIDFNAEYVKAIIDSKNHGYQYCCKLVDEFLSSTEMPSVIVCYTGGSIVKNLMAALESRSINTPNDISVTCFDGLPRIETNQSIISRYATDWSSLGSLGAVQLINRLNGDDSPPKRNFVSGQFYLGDTVQPNRLN